MEWLSFLNHDLPMLIDFCEEIQEVSIQHHLNKSQTRALYRKTQSRFRGGLQRLTMRHGISVKTWTGWIQLR